MIADATEFDKSLICSLPRMQAGMLKTLLPPMVYPPANHPQEFAIDKSKTYFYSLFYV